MLGVLQGYSKWRLCLCYALWRSGDQRGQDGYWWILPWEGPRNSSGCELSTMNEDTGNHNLESQWWGMS